jgi:phosphate/sulfate permease
MPPGCCGRRTVMRVSRLGLKIENDCRAARCISRWNHRRRGRSGVSAVRWGVTHNIMVAWVITLPVSAGASPACYEIATLFAR